MCRDFAKRDVEDAHSSIEDLLQAPLWENLVQTEGKIVLRFLYLRLGNQQDAEDCLQIALEKLLSSILKGTFKREEPIEPFFWGIVKNALYDFLKTRKKNQPADKEVSLMPDKRSEYDLRQVDLAIYLGQLSDQGKLSNFERSVFFLYVMGSLPPREIAFVLAANKPEVTPRQVTNALSRAFQKIKLVV